MSDKLFSYPTPEKHPNCLCRQYGRLPFFCLTGHLTECHSGMDCADALCSHLPRYSDDPEEFNNFTTENAPVWMVKGISNGHDVFSLVLYAPSEGMAKSVVEDWIGQTEHLSKIDLKYEITSI